MKISRINPFNNEMRTKDFDITLEQMNAYNNGHHVQVAFPHLSADDREFIISGITGEEFNELFNDA